MINLNQSQVFYLSKHAYDVQQGLNKVKLENLRMSLPFIDIGSVKLLTATSGLITPVSSGFGFMAQLNGGRTREIVIATRGRAVRTIRQNASVATIHWLFVRCFNIAYNLVR